MTIKKILEKLTKNEYEFILIFLSLFVVFIPHFFYNAITGGDNSIIISNYQFISNIIDSFQINTEWAAFNETKVNPSNDFIFSFFYIILDAIGFEYNISKKIFIFLIVFFGTFFFFQLTKYFFKNKFITYACSIIFATSNGFVDYYAMGWTYSLIGLYTAPALFYFIIRYFEDDFCFNIYLSYIFLSIFILLSSIQSAFLIFSVYLFSLYFLKKKNYKIFSFFFFVFFILSIFLSVFNLFENYNTSVSSFDISNSSISQGLTGVVNPFFNFIHFNNFVNNTSLYFAADNKNKIILISLTTFSWIGLGFFFYRGKKNRFYLFFIIFFLIENILYCIYKAYYHLELKNNFIKIIFSVFRDPARLGSINNFLIYIYIGYFFYIFNIYLRRLKIKNFGYFFLIIFIYVSLHNYSSLYNFNTIKTSKLTKEFIEKENFIKETNLNKIIFLPIRTNVKLSVYLMDGTQDIESIDPLKRFNMNKIFTWNTDKSSKIEKKFYSCDKDNKFIHEKINCLQKNKMNFHYLIDIRNFNNEKINLIDYIKRTSNYKIIYYKHFVLLEDIKNGSYIKKYESYGLKKNVSNDENFHKLNLDLTKYNFTEYNLNDFFKTKFLIAVKLTKNLILNKKIDDNLSAFYYNKKQFIMDIFVFFLTLIITLNIIIIIFVNLFKNKIIINFFKMIFKS